MPNGDRQSYGDLLYSDPNAAVDQLLADVDRRIQQAVSTSHQQAAGQRQFWESFYAGHGDLDPQRDHDLVQTVLHANISTLADLPVEEAKAKLGELVTERVSRYRGYEPGESAQDRYRREREREENSVFSGGPHHGTYSEAPRPERGTSLGDMIRARRAARASGGRRAAAE